MNEKAVGFPEVTWWEALGVMLSAWQGLMTRLSFLACSLGRGVWGRGRAWWGVMDTAVENLPVA